MAIGSGAKFKVNVLKPNNSVKSKSNSKNSFDDGSKMGSKLSNIGSGPLTLRLWGMGWIKINILLFM